MGNTQGIFLFIFEGIFFSILSYIGDLTLASGGGNLDRKRNMST